MILHCVMARIQVHTQNRRQTTGLGLSADDAFIGLVDYGLFGDKLPLCLTSKGLSDHVSKELLPLTTESSKRRLKKILKGRNHDCVSMVLLREYAKRHKIKSIRDAIRERANKLKGIDSREQDRFWLLIYQVWREKTLRDEGQTFLADLKRERFNFVHFP